MLLGGFGRFLGELLDLRQQVFELLVELLLLDLDLFGQLDGLFNLAGGDQFVRVLDVLLVICVLLLDLLEGL